MINNFLTDLNKLSYNSISINEAVNHLKLNEIEMAKCCFSLDLDNIKKYPEVYNLIKLYNLTWEK